MKIHQSKAIFCIVLSVLLFGLNITSARANLIILGVTSTTVNPYPYGGSGESIGLSVPNTIELNGISGAVDFNVAVPAGYQINVDPISGTWLVIDVAWDGVGQSGLSLSSPMNVSFTGLAGTAPIFGNYASVGNGYLSLNLIAKPVAPFSFTGLQFSIPVTGTGNDLDYPLVTDTLNIQHGGELSISAVPDVFSTAGMFSVSFGLLFIVRQLARLQSNLPNIC